MVLREKNLKEGEGVCRDAGHTFGATPNQKPYCRLIGSNPIKSDQMRSGEANELYRIGPKVSKQKIQRERERNSDYYL